MLARLCRVGRYRIQIPGMSHWLVFHRHSQGCIIFGGSCGPQLLTAIDLVGVEPNQEHNGEDDDHELNMGVSEN